MQTSSYTSIFHCLNECIHTNNIGWKGLYAGYSAILIRDLPYFALQLGCYDNIKNILGNNIYTNTNVYYTYSYIYLYIF